jgi:hypothetical protein
MGDVATIFAHPLGELLGNIWLLTAALQDFSVVVGQLFLLKIVAAYGAAHTITWHRASCRSCAGLPSFQNLSVALLISIIIH